MEIYKLEDLNDYRIKVVLESVRKKIAKVMGVTLTGNRLTIRFDEEGLGFVNVHMVILSVSSEVIDDE